MANPLKRGKGIGHLFLIAICLLFFGGEASSHATEPNDPSPASIGAFGDRPVKMDSLIARIAYLSASPALAEREAHTAGLPLEKGKAQVHIAIAEGAQDAVSRAIRQTGGDVTGQAEGGRRLQAWLPIGAIAPLAERGDVWMIRQPPLAEPMETFITSEGVAASGASSWHTSGWLGQGVRVGIIDLGFLGYPELLGSELPANVIVKNFVDWQTDDQVNGTTPHGTACAEIVHDMAPQADLYLAKIATNVDLAEAVTWLKDVHHVHIISTSIGFFNVSPGDGTGPLADLAQTAAEADILWVTAAGNYRKTHWSGPWLDQDHDGNLEFGPNLETNRFKVNGSYLLPAGINLCAFLRWSDWATVKEDYDLFLMRWNGSKWEIVAPSEDSQNGGPGQTPTERACATTKGEAAEYAVVIQRRDASQNVHFELLVTGASELQAFVYARSLPNLADAPATFTVSAVWRSSPYGQEPYSSEGPTNGPGGSASGGFPKPDVAAYDGVTTSAYPEFYGTSASTPHVAGAAALIRGAYPAWSAGDVRTFLEGHAIDMGSPGRDTQYGYGRLSLGVPPLIDIKMRLWLPILQRASAP